MSDNLSSCPHCNQQHPPDIKICPVTEQPLICEVCGVHLPSRGDECPNCGAILLRPVARVAPMAPTIEVPPMQPETPPQEVKAEVVAPPTVEIRPPSQPVLPKQTAPARHPKLPPEKKEPPSPVIPKPTIEAPPVQLCPSCGKANLSDAIYCAYCARRLKEALPEVKLPEIPKKVPDVPKKVLEAPKEIAKTPKEITLRFSFWPITVDFVSRWFLWYFWQREVVADWVFWIGQIFIISVGILVWASSRYNKIREDACYSTTDFNVSPESTTWSVLLSLLVVGWGIYIAVSLSAGWASWLRVAWAILIFFIYGIYIIILYVTSVVAPPSKAAPKKREWIRVAGWVFLVVVICVGLAWVLAWLISRPEATLPNATAISSATLDWTATAYAEKTANARAAATATAQARATDTARAITTAAAQARATATAQARIDILGAIESNKLRAFGPQDGSLVHEVDTYVKTYSVGVALRDFIVEAEFLNPYSASTSSWDYGFLFRDEGGDQQFRLVIRSDRYWTLLNVAGNADVPAINEGEIPTLNISDGGSNWVRLICQGERGWLFVNGEFIAELDLSARTNAGDITIATGLYEGDEINGKTTNFKNFSIWSII